MSTNSAPSVNDLVHNFGSTSGTNQYTFKDLEPNTTYYYCAVVYYEGSYYYGIVKSFMTEDLTMNGEVDLGLGIKWSACNLGATASDEPGNYYAWGETETKDVADFKKDKYLYYDSTGENYINIGSDISNTQYDVAKVKLGSGWRMPTRDETAKLRNKCQWTAARLNGKYGHLVKGPNGNYIFIITVSCTETSSSKLRNSQFWTSTLSDKMNYTANDAAYYLNYDYFNVENTFRAKEVERHVGLPVRPVKD